MYDGKGIRAGDVVFIFDSETQGGAGLLGLGRVVSAAAAPRSPGRMRQTPRVDVTIGEIALAAKRLGRSELKPFSAWEDGRPETELNFKFYRQATNKIVGLTSAAAGFLEGFFDAEPAA